MQHQTAETFSSSSQNLPNEKILLQHAGPEESIFAFGLFNNEHKKVKFNVLIEDLPGKLCVLDLLFKIQ